MRPIPVLPDNADTWRLWCAVQTQWRVGWCPIGLDYAALYAVAQTMDISITPRMLRGIQAMEIMVLESVERDNGKTAQRTD